jgi:hypothetical protein
MRHPIVAAVQGDFWPAQHCMLSFWELLLKNWTCVQLLSCFSPFFTCRQWSALANGSITHANGKHFFEKCAQVPFFSNNS